MSEAAGAVPAPYILDVSILIALARGDYEQAVELAAVIARTGLDPWDAHVAVNADTSVCPILTLDGGKWRQHANDLDEPSQIIEIVDPDDD